MAPSPLLLAQWSRYFLTLATSASVIADALFPHEPRMYVATDAMSAFESCPFHAGIWPL